MPDNPHARTCPRCARIVPRRIDRCRCGREWSASDEPQPAAQSDRDPAQASGARSSPSPLAWALPVAAIIVLAGLVVLWRRPQPPEPGAEPVPAVETALASAVAEPASPEPPPVTPAPGGADAAVAAPVAPTSVVPAPAVLPSVSSPGSFADVVSRCAPAVVTIESAVGLGTGFFVSPTQVLTNYHVVAQNATVTLRFRNGQQARGRVTARSPDADLALVESEVALADRALELRQVSSVRAGEEVLAIGSPALGRSALETSVTRGIVSGIRSLGGITVVQTDAALNPGNSGGPLVDADGRVVGVNTIKAVQQESIGFAVASDYAQALLEGRPIGAVTDSTRGVASPGQVPTPVPSAAPSQTEVEREAGAQMLDQQAASVAPHAARFTRMVERYRDACLTQSGVRSQSWQSVERYVATDSAAAPECLSLRSEIGSLKADISDALRQLTDIARRSGVYPGTIRSVYVKYGLAWEGWER